MDSIPARQKRDHNCKKKNRRHENIHSSKKSSSITESITVVTSDVKNPTKEECKQFSKRDISNVSNKYSEIVLNDETEVLGVDFNQLLLASSSIGSHFLFNSEKNLEANDDWYNRDEYFQLNLVELAKSLSTIPFYKRQNLDKNLFSSEEIDGMDRHARYQKCKMFENKKNSEILTKSDGFTPIKSTKEPKTNLVGIKVEIGNKNHLDEFLTNLGKLNIQPHRPSSSTSQNSAEGATTQSSENLQSGIKCNDDIQKWLDDVLDI